LFELFSVDDHIIEPPGVWLDRVPRRYRDQAPHVIEEDGRQYWVYEDTRAPTMGLNAVAGKPREQWQNEPVRYSDMIPGCYDPVERAKDLRSQGIYASVNFPSLPRFAGTLFLEFKDKDLAAVCVRAWNDYVLDEWCAAAPTLFVPMVIVPLWDPAAAASEVRRCVGKGARAITMVENPSPLGQPSFHTDHWDPIWDVCVEADIPVCMHIASSGRSTVLTTEEPGIVEIATAFTRAAHSSVNMMLSPIPRKFPGVKLVWSEGGIGWIPAALERADRQFDRHRHWSRSHEDIRPSEVCRRNMWFCMIEEPVGLQYRNDIGVERILWESDYPHADTTFPDTQEGAEVVFKDVPHEEITRITHGNASELFKWDFVTAPCR
jgi:predicted TIM-barrel fold metal-dependent hydrolase